MKKAVVKTICIAILIAMSLVSFASATDTKKVSDSFTATPEVTYIPERKFTQDDIDELNKYLSNGGTLHYEDTGSKWAGNTHRFIVNQAGLILKTDKTATPYNKINELVWDGSKNVNAMTVIADYAVLADTLERDFVGVVPTFQGHFYGANGKNYLGYSDPTAYTRFNNHYYNAKVHYAANRKFEAYKSLGLSLHYLADLCVPHHAANLIAGPLSYHSEYEAWVNTRYSSYSVTSNPSSSYDYVKTATFKAMADSWSGLARAQTPNANAGRISGYQWNGTAMVPVYVWDSTNASIATNDCLPRAQRGSAAMLYRFLVDTGRAQ